MNMYGQLLKGYRAKTYDYRGTLWSRIKAKHLSLVNPTQNQRVLDVGCGTGKTLALLRQKCDNSVELYGLEPSDDMLRQARIRLKRKAHIRQGIAQELPWPDNYFDIVMSTQVLHHLPADEKKKMLQEIYRVLRVGGQAFVSDWGRPISTSGKLLDTLWRAHAYIPENHQIMTPTAFRKAGFKNAKEESIQFGVLHHIIASK